MACAVRKSSTRKTGERPSGWSWIQKKTQTDLNSSEKYAGRGVSAAKEEVHAAVEKLDHGLYPKAFCKVYPDFLAGDADWCNLMSSDGSGTKSVLAYLYWKETGNTDVWKGIARDVIAMNLDDLLCVGATNDFLFSSLINRNKHLIPGEVIKALIEGTDECFSQLNDHRIRVRFLGGETADLGDAVRTMTVDGTMTARMKREELILTHNIRPGQVIVGLASYGQSGYEDRYNSGIGSNGLTSARHDVLSSYYKTEFPESYDAATDDALIYCGNHRLTDTHEASGHEIGHLLLSPTRTFAPVISRIISELGGKRIGGIIHCTGGGQTKVLHYVNNVHIIKDALLPVPPVFDLIQEASATSPEEMYKVYNMGTRMNIYVDESDAGSVVDVARSFGIEGAIVGRVEANSGAKVSVVTSGGTLEYDA